MDIINYEIIRDFEYDVEENSVNHSQLYMNKYIISKPILNRHIRFNNLQDIVKLQDFEKKRTLNEWKILIQDEPLINPSLLNYSEILTDNYLFDIELKKIKTYFENQVKDDINPFSITDQNKNEYSFNEFIIFQLNYMVSKFEPLFVIQNKEFETSIENFDLIVNFKLITPYFSKLHYHIWLLLIEMCQELIKEKFKMELEILDIYPAFCGKFGHNSKKTSLINIESKNAAIKKYRLKPILEKLVRVVHIFDREQFIKYENWIFSFYEYKNPNDQIKSEIYKYLYFENLEVSNKIKLIFEYFKNEEFKKNTYASISIRRRDMKNAEICNHICLLIVILKLIIEDISGKKIIHKTRLELIDMILTFEIIN
jgi:hypothetical protein